MPQTPQQEIERLDALMGSDRDPDGRAFAPLSDALRRAGDLERATEVVRRGVTAHERFASGWIAAGWVHRDAGRADEAGEAFRKALALDAENSLAVLGLAALAEARDDVQAALDYYRRAQTLDHSDPELGARIELLEDLVQMEEPAAEPEPVAEPDPDPVSVEALAPAHDPEPVSVEAPAPVHDPEPVSVDALAPDPEPAAVPETAVEADPEPAAEADPEPAVEARPVLDIEDLAPHEGEMLTRSMGEVFARQGLTGQAIDVYERLVERDPSDASLQARLMELKRAASEPEGTVDVTDLAPDEPSRAEGPVSIDSLAPDS